MMPNKPYIKQLESVGDCAVWEVDGEYIRNNLNREFTNFGHHYRFPFIPTLEFWIDKEYAPDELKYFIENLYTSWSLIRGGISYSEAMKRAETNEKRERLKDAFSERVRGGVCDIVGVVPKEVYIKKLDEYKGADVWVVDGKIVRDIYFLNFTEGGHHFVYDFIPQKEVWLDNDLKPQERDFVLLHELHERYLMFTGLTYESAHRSSSIIEHKCRKEPDLLGKCLEEELEKNRLINGSNSGFVVVKQA